MSKICKIGKSDKNHPTIIRLFKILSHSSSTDGLKEDGVPNNESSDTKRQLTILPHRRMILSLSPRTFFFAQKR